MWPRHARGVRENLFCDESKLGEGAAASSTTTPKDDFHDLVQYLTGEKRVSVNTSFSVRADLA
jgi:hypothetical protein